MYLRDIDTELVALVAVEARLVQRNHILGRMIDTEGELVDDGRAQRVDHGTHQAARVDAVVDGQLRPHVGGQRKIKVAAELFGVVDGAHVERGFRAGVPVKPQNFIAPRMIHRALEDRVEGALRVEVVRQREELQKGLSGGVETIPGNDVAGELHFVVQRVADRGKGAV